MSQRDEIMQKFGPVLLEAFAIVVFDDLNRIRSHVGMSPLTWEQFFAEINNHTSELEFYDWMGDS